MQRPLGATIIAILLMVLGVAGFGNAYVALTESDYGPSIVALVALLYGITAFAAAVGLWRRKRWAHPAFLLWAGVVLVGTGVFQVFVAKLAWTKVAGFLVMIVAVLYFAARYVRKVSTAAL